MDKKENKILGLISESWSEEDFYGYVIDCVLLGESEFNYSKVVEEFESAVLKQDIPLQPNKYSKRLTQEINTVFRKIIMPMIQKEWDKVYGFIASYPEQYEHFVYVNGYDGYRCMIQEVIGDALSGVMFPSYWGFIDENEMDIEEA